MRWSRRALSEDYDDAAKQDYQVSTRHTPKDHLVPLAIETMEYGFHFEQPLKAT